MLYKKIHRQFLREFRVGREFKFFDVLEEVYEVTQKPYIDINGIMAYLKGDSSGVNMRWYLIHTSGYYKGRILSNGNIAWLED